MMKIKNLLPLLAMSIISLNTGAQDDAELRMIVGTYTGTGSRGIYSMTFNTATGASAPLSSCFVYNPSYLTVSADGSRIYAISEMSDEQAAVYALALDKASGTMRILNSRPTVGTDPCYVATNGTIVATANYGGSMSVFPIEHDGELGEMSLFVEGTVGGPDQRRQSTPHIHCTEFSPDGRTLAVSDFSADRLLLYSIDRNGKLTPVATSANKAVSIPVDADTGPRHIVFSSDSRYAYMIGELSGKVTVLQVKGHSMTPVQTIEADHNGGRASADIHLSPDGRFLYASVRRANDGIAIFSVDPNDGQLTEIGYQPTGLHPRNFALSPDGRWLLCACRDSDRIEIYSVDKKSGLLTFTGRTIDIPKPVCIKFVK